MASPAYAVFQRIADQQAPAVARQFLRAIEQIQKATSLLRLATAIERGDLAAVNAEFVQLSAAREIRKAAELIREVTLAAMRTETLRVADNASIRTVFTQANARAVEAAEQQAARMVTRINAETRKTIRQAIADSVAGGLTPQQTAKRIQAVIGLTPQQARAVEALRRRLEAAGEKDVDGQIRRYAAKLLRLRATTIARTETMAAANRGQQAVWKAMQDKGLLPDGVQRRWIVTPDDRLCPLCKSVDGQSVGLTEPFHTPLGDVMNPPLHPNCLPADALVSPSGQIAAVSERPFDGDIVVVHTASGKRLACTPNHPVLTPQGWIGAHLLDVGGEVVSQRRVQGVVIGDEHREHVPTRFHQVAEAHRRAAQVSAMPVPVSAEDFHGDGFGSEIAVVWTDSTLMHGRDAAVIKELGYEPFQVADVQAFGLNGLSVLDLGFDADGAAGGCAMCGGDLSAALGDRHLLPLQGFRFAASARLNAVRQQAAPDAVAVESEFPGEREFRSAGEVFADEISRIDIGSASHLPVYNMETPRGWYVANGIITHNCRCAMSLDVQSLAPARSAARPAA